MKRTKANMWSTLTCPNCGDNYRYEDSVSTPDAELQEYSTTRSTCSFDCAEDWLESHPMQSEAS